jgi:hypothetical protein
MTIFGFNTNVQQGDVVYHVESQARQSDLLLQTLVFVKGQCVGKHAFSFAAKTLQPGFSEAAMHELLKAQHKAVVDAMQRGQVELVLGTGGEIEDVGASGLALKWSNPSDPSQGGRIIMRFQVLDLLEPVSGAEVTVRACPPAAPTVLVRSITDFAGNAVLVVPMTEPIEQQSAVIAKAICGEKSVTRKLRFRK